MYADRKQWPLEETIVKLTHSRVHAEDEERCAGGADARLDRLDRDLTLVGPLTPEQRQRLLEIADRCPVHRTLSAGVRIATQLHGSVADPGDDRTEEPRSPPVG
jgi:putative redox protein